MLTQYGTVTCACRRCGTSVRSLWQRQCLLMWCSCKKNKMGQVFVRLQRLYFPWSCMCSAMHIDLCALNWYGCLLVALDISVLINATIYKFSARRQDFLMLMYRAFFFFLSQTSCYWKMYLVIVIPNIKLNCSFTMLSPCINYAFNLSI